MSRAKPKSTSKAGSLPGALIGTQAEAVAKLAGVSIVTVSRAMNRSPLVSDKTRARVIEAATQLGYRPNPIARAFRQQKSNVMAIVLQAHQLEGWFYSEMISAFHSEIHRRELSVLLCIVPNEESPAAWLNRTIRGAAFDGVVIHHEFARTAGLDVVRNLQIPAVLAGIISKPATKDIGCVGFDHQDAVAQTVRYLAALGHRRIAWLDTPQAPRPGMRERFFRKEMARAGLPLVEEWMTDAAVDDDPLAGTEAMHAIYARKPPYPTAVICGSDMIAAGAIDGAHRWGRTVPGDLSVVGYGNERWAKVVKPGITTLHQRGWDLGIALSKKLLALCDGKPEGTGTLALPMPLIVRESTDVAR